MLLGALFETASLSPALEKKATEYLLSSIDWGGGDADRVAWELGIDPNEAGLDRTNPEVEKEIWHWAQGQVYQAWYTIHAHFHGNTIRAYRIITAPKTWEPTGRHPGIYWSWDEHAADAHWGSSDPNHVDWLITADLTFDQIDWPATLGQNGHPSFEDEAEIRVLPNSHVHIVSVKHLT